MYYYAFSYKIILWRNMFSLFTYGFIVYYGFILAATLMKIVYLYFTTYFIYYFQFTVTIFCAILLHCL